MNTISRSYLNVQNRRKPNSEKMRKTRTVFFMVTLKNWWAWPELDDLSIPDVTFIVLFAGWSFWLCLAKSLRKTVSKQVRVTRREQQDPAYIHGGHWGYRHRAGHGEQKYLLFIKTRTSGRSAPHVLVPVPHTQMLVTTSNVSHHPWC